MRVARGSQDKEKGATVKTNRREKCKEWWRGAAAYHNTDIQCMTSSTYYSLMGA